MERKEEVFEGKNFDKKTLDLLNNFIEEFDELFGKYVSREEIINRIKENLNHSIEFEEFDSKEILGEYNSAENKISLKNGLDEEQLKSVFFHEMIHCITKEENCVGFFKQIYDRNNKIKREQVVGFTEGFTQYISKLRAEKYGGHSNAYPILTEQVENMADLIGKEKFLDMAFNNRGKFPDALIEAGLIDYQGEESSLLEQFDVIWACEKDIYAAKVNSGTEIGLLMKDKLNKSTRSVRLNDARISIITTYLAKYEKKANISKEDLAEMYKLINTYAKQLVLDEQYEAYSTFFRKIIELEEDGVSREEILDMVPEEAKELVKHDMNFRDMSELDSTDWLKKVARDIRNLYDNVIEGDFEEYYLEQIARKIFKGNISNKYAIDVACSLISGIAETILDKDYNIDTLSFELINFKAPGKVFNMYNANGESLEYLGTFSTINEDLAAEELQICTDEDTRKEILRKNPNFSENDVLFVAKSGFVLGYMGEDSYTAIDENGRLLENIGVTYNSSYAEKIQNNLISHIRRYKILEQLGTPNKILEEESRRIRELRGLTKKNRGKDKFVLQDIENATQNVSLDEIEDILAEITGPKTTLKESFEKGIGYNE